MEREVGAIDAGEFKERRHGRFCDEESGGSRADLGTTAWST